MNIALAQRELFNALINRTGRPGVLTDGDIKMYSPNGYVAYCIRNSEIMLDESKFRLLEDTPKTNFGKTDDDQLIKPTNGAIILKKGIARLYTSDDGLKIYINEKLMKCFDNPKLYAFQPIGRVAVYEKDTFVGIVLPIRPRVEHDALVSPMELEMEVSNG